MCTRSLFLLIPTAALLAAGCRAESPTSHAPAEVASASQLSPKEEAFVATEPRAGDAPPAAATAMARALASPPPATPAMRMHAGGLGAAKAGGPAARPSSGDPLAVSPPMAADAPAGRSWIGNGGSIKAGEWDDNANYRDFQRYLANEEGLPLHRIDVSDRHFLVVRDSDGKGIPRCPVIVTDVTQHRITLTTTAGGRAVLFPHGEHLDGSSFQASTNCAGASTTARFALEDQDGIVDLELHTKRALPAQRTIDIAFILDTTGSMSEEIAAVKSTIGKVASSLRQSNVGVRIGLVEYKDRGDPFVTKVHPMSQNMDRFLADVSSIEAGGGGDTPESVNEGIHVGLTQLAWGNDSIGKYAFLIGDAPPHLDYANDADYAVDMRDAAHRGIQIFTIAASGMDTLGQAVWRQVAQYTDATNMFVLRGGAGPQSTGAGDPKSSCGGTQTQYASGNLDALILSKIQHELKGLDRDPMRIPGLRSDENAKACNERVAMD